LSLILLDADHIHEGNGFIAQHIKMTNIFEKAMQAVDPSISLPYWDFTIESATNTSIMFSPIFTDATFGSMPQPPDAYWGWTYSSSTMKDAAIPNGRWAYIMTEVNTKYDDLNYAYGYLRAPWNMNPSEYITRFTSTNKHLPSCSSHYQLLAYDELSDFLFNIPYGAHAATHGVIGGVYGCDAMDYLQEAGYILSDDGQLNLCKNWIFYLKEFYRLDYIVPHKNCTLVDGSTAFDDLQCGFTCNTEYDEQIYIHLTKILNSDYDCVPDDMSDEGWTAWYDFICSGDGYKVFGGDHLESASPADPSFWPIHPTLERLLQAKYMAGGFQDNTWPTDPINDYVCDKAECYDVSDDNLGFGYWGTCCYGHYETDQLMNAPDGDRDSYTSYTNAEIHTMTDAGSLSYGMPYIYDEFAWDHCADIGMDFINLLQSNVSRLVEHLNRFNVYLLKFTAVVCCFVWFIGSAV
jgi:Common central domain of tyrosinase